MSDCIYMEDSDLGFYGLVLLFKQTSCLITRHSQQYRKAIFLYSGWAKEWEMGVGGGGTRGENELQRHLKNSIHSALESELGKGFRIYTNQASQQTKMASIFPQLSAHH